MTNDPQVCQGVCIGAVNGRASSMSRNMTSSITRRRVLGSAGSLAGAAIGLAVDTAGAQEGGALAGQGAAAIRVRLLATSDLHMFVQDWDYFNAKPDPTVGLLKVASLIRAARAEAANTLLFDNGDFIQGNPLADYVAEQPSPTPSAPHPLIRIMGELGYDAIGLGNHEFNYGLEFLEASLAGAGFPVVCANVARSGGAEFLPPTAVIARRVKDENGAEVELRIGVIGFVPPQIMVWDKARLDGRIEAGDIVLAAKRHMPALRARCDLVVALCHSGIRPGPWVEGAENAAAQLAAVPGIDALITGHSHRVFPGEHYANLEGIDAQSGLINGVPAVMPGFWGSHLGVIDLVMTRASDGRWSVSSSKVATRAIASRKAGKTEALAPPDAAVASAIAPAHRGALAWVEQPAGAVDAPVHSYLVWAGYDPATALVTTAQAWYVRGLLASNSEAALPLLSASAPYRAGYTPDGYVDIAAGKTSLREVAGLYLYSSNTVVAVKVTGAQVLEWLEFSARMFNTIDPSATTPQPLLDTRVPSYNFDTIAGITYSIDVTKPPRYGAPGKFNADARRIGDLRFEGVPVDPAREFLVVTNNYRADGGGGFPGLGNAKIVLRAPDSNRDVVLRYFRAHPTVTVPRSFPWRFAASGKPVAVTFDTGKPAARHLGDVPGVTAMGEGETGYLRVGLTLR
jgi:2',3'-cyclic-nucleotide 2'-phosphodiesterase/3'-nucleotidase